MGLVTLAAVVYPFSTGAPLDQKCATAVVNLVLGAAIASLLTAVAARAIRNGPSASGPAAPADPAGPRYEAADPRYGHEPTQPIYTPRRRTSGE